MVVVVSVIKSIKQVAERLRPDDIKMLHILIEFPGARICDLDRCFDVKQI